MTDAEKILELMHDGDSAEAIMRKILADRERLIAALDTAIVHMEFCDTLDENKTNGPTLDIFCKPALAQSAQTNDEILGERE